MNLLRMNKSSEDVINGGGVEQVIFESCEHITTSDHKPVRSIFNIKVFPNMDVINPSTSAAEEDVYIVEIFGLQAKSLRAFDKDGTSDPYFRVHMTPQVLLILWIAKTCQNQLIKIRLESWKSKPSAIGQASKVCVSTSVEKNTLNPSWIQRHTCFRQN